MNNLTEKQKKLLRDIAYLYRTSDIETELKQEFPKVFEDDLKLEMTSESNSITPKNEARWVLYLNRDTHKIHLNNLHYKWGLNNSLNNSDGLDTILTPTIK